MDALALECVGVNGQSGDQGLALSGLHLCNLTLVQDQSANELTVVVALFKAPSGDLPDGCKGFSHDVAQGLSFGQPSPKLRSHSLEFLVCHLLEIRLKFGNPFGHGG